MMRIHYYKSYRYQNDKQNTENKFMPINDTSAEIIKYIERDKLPNFTLI